MDDVVFIKVDVDDNPDSKLIYPELNRWMCSDRDMRKLAALNTS